MLKAGYEFIGFDDIINAKIKTQCALEDVLEPVGSPAVIENTMVSNLPLRVVPSLRINLREAMRKVICLQNYLTNAATTSTTVRDRRDCHGQSKW